MRCGVSEVTRSSKELEALQEKMQGEEKKASASEEALMALNRLTEMAKAAVAKAAEEKAAAERAAAEKAAAEQAAAEKAAADKAAAEKSFHEFDTDESGELSTGEVQAVLKAMGCSPFKGTLQRLIDAVDDDSSGTLDFNEFISLLLEIRQMYRTFCRFAVVDNNVKKVPQYRLTTALIFEFGAQAADLARQLAKQDGRSMRRAKSLWMMASSRRTSLNGTEKSGSGSLTFRQFVTWSRRMKDCFGKNADGTQRKAKSTNMCASSSALIRAKTACWTGQR
eukprot:g27801.t1